MNDTMKADSDWLINNATKFIFEICGYDVTQQEADDIRDEYFTPEELGDYQMMARGFTDVSK